MKTYRSFSSNETQKIGQDLGEALLSRRSKKDSGATVVALVGDLGAGKTTFVQGFFKGIGLKRRATSPTFVLMRRHRLKKSAQRKDIYHLDAYRLKDAAQLKPLGMEQIITDPQNVVLIEWAERVKKMLPRNTHRVQFRYGKRENERHITVRPGRD